MTFSQSPAKSVVGKPNGLWPSPITPAVLSQASGISEAEWSPDGRYLIWLEEHSGQGLLFASDLSGNDARRLSGEESVRAHIGYGGGNFTVGLEEVYYVAADGRLYAQALETGAPHAITPPGTLCASPTLSPDGRWLVYVYELEGEAGLAVVDPKGHHWPRKLVSGRDFYMQPAWHPKGKALAWISWNHPQLPWDGTSLELATLDWNAEGPHLSGPKQIASPRTLAGGGVAGGDSESVLQPQFSPTGEQLAYCSDRDGWYRVYALKEPLEETGAGWTGAGEEDRGAVCLTRAPGEHGGAAWQQGMRWIGWLPEGKHLLCTRNVQGAVGLTVVSADGSGGRDLQIEPYTTLTRPVVNPVDGRVAVLAAGAAHPTRLIVFEPPEGKLPPTPRPAAENGGSDEQTAGSPGVRIVRRSAIERIPPGDISPLEYCSWVNEAGETVHGLFAPPRNSRHESRGLPPLVVQIHGGPTSQAYRTWRPDAQFFTSRGYAFLDVNHRGSTGYGRAYREQLREQWGVLDVADTVSGVRYVSDQGWADATRCAIKGGSAGGYTVLRAITLHPDLFQAAVSFYGISELFALTRETHKFEAHYTDSLIGPLPEQAERYRERSPIQLADRIRTPLLLLQGAEDKVVPPNQAELIVASLRTRNIPHEYILFAGEGHGFRKRENIRAALEAMEQFLATHLVYG